MKTQGEKIKTQGEKIKTRGKNKDRGGKFIIYFPRLKYSAQILSQKKIVFSGKLAIFSPQYTVCESRTIIAWPKGEKIKTLGEKISYIFPPVGFLCTFSVTIKIIGEKI